jgi:hypothetical protein
MGKPFTSKEWNTLLGTSGGEEIVRLWAPFAKGAQSRRLRCRTWRIDRGGRSRC